MKLWDRIQRGMEVGFDSTIAAVQSITEKAGEGIELTRLRREKVILETQVTRRLAELGNTVYEKISAERDDDIAHRFGIKDILIAVAQDEAKMVEIDRHLKKVLNKSE